MKAQSKNAPRPWRKVRIEEIFAPLEDGRTMHQGWSPQCEKQPSRSEKVWGVLRTTSIQPGEFQPEHNKLLPSKLEPRPLLEVKPGDILITCAGPRIRCGISCLVENTRGRLMISGKMYRFRTRPDEVLPKYLVAFLQSEDAATAIDGMKTGGSESGLNLTHERFRQLLVPIGPLAEQQRIVGLLDEAFEGLATAKANAEKNLQNARALFESHLQSVFTERGPGWVEKKLEEIGKTQTGSTPKTSDQSNYGDFISFVKPGDFNTDGTLDYDKDGLSESGAEGARIVPAGSVLMVCIGATIGKCGYCDQDVTTNQQVNALTPSDGSSNRFIYYQMLTETFQRKVIHASGQATLPIINKSKWSALSIWLPPKVAEQKKIAAKFDALVEETQRLARLYERKHAALSALKKSLLHQAFTGIL